MDPALKLAETLQQDPDSANVARAVLAVAAAKKGDFAAAKRFVEALPEAGANRLLKPGFLAWIAFGQNDQAGAARRCGRSRASRGCASSSSCTWR